MLPTTSTVTATTIYRYLLGMKLAEGALDHILNGHVLDTEQILEGAIHTDTHTQKEKERENETHTERERHTHTRDKNLVLST